MTEQPSPLCGATPEARGPSLVVVDADPERRARLGGALRSRGFGVQAVADRGDALEAVHDHRADLVLVDAQHDGLRGIEICAIVRSMVRTPLVVLGRLGDDEHVVAAVLAGADAYLTTPVDDDVLAASLRAVLRRCGPRTVEPPLAVGDLTIDTAAAQTRRGEQLVHLTRTEYRLLVDLARHPRQVRSRQELYEAAWGPSPHPGPPGRTIDVHIRRLRVKIGPGAIETVQGQGYRAAE